MPPLQTALRSFFALYRGTADDEPMAAAVLSVARTLLKLGGPEDKTLVARGAEDPLTSASVKTELAAFLAKRDANATKDASPKEPTRDAAPPEP